MRDARKPSALFHELCGTYVVGACSMYPSDLSWVALLGKARGPQSGHAGFGTASCSKISAGLVAFPCSLPTFRRPRPLMTRGPARLDAARPPAPLANNGFL